MYYFYRDRLPYVIFVLFLLSRINPEKYKTTTIVFSVSSLVLGGAIVLEFLSKRWYPLAPFQYALGYFIGVFLLYYKTEDFVISTTLSSLGMIGAGWLYEMPMFFVGGYETVFRLNTNNVLLVGGQVFAVVFFFMIYNYCTIHNRKAISVSVIMYFVYVASFIKNPTFFYRNRFLLRSPTILFVLLSYLGINQSQRSFKKE